jgi:DNA repair exonuclease SbcCD ATPase subunit
MCRLPGVRAAPRRENQRDSSRGGDSTLDELRQREGRCPERLTPLRTYLEKQRDCLLAFAVQLDRDLDKVAATFQAPVEVVRETLAVEALDAREERREQREDELQQRLAGRYPAIRAAVAALRREVVRASSVVENLNSRLRNYFTLRRRLGGAYLSLLQFFLNHRRFMRSEQADRVEQSPAELLTGKTQPHWLELLGYRLFRRHEAAAGQQANG